MKRANWGAKHSAVSAVGLALFFSAEPAQAIVFGTADGNSHPEVGGLMVLAPKYGFPVCSGTLIDKDSNGRGLYLTAGHCVQAISRLINLGEFTQNHVWVNFNENPHDGTNVPVKSMYQWLITPSSAIETRQDMGVLVLQADDPNDLPEPAVLAPVGFLDPFTQRELRASTWVSVGYGGSLLFPPPSIVYRDQRQQATPRYLNLIHYMIKTQQNGPSGSSGGCSGDSGGPLYWVDPDTDEELLVGVTIGGTHQCNSIGLYYRVDSQVAHDFIDKYRSSSSVSRRIR
jgi:Trypsin